MKIYKLEKAEDKVTVLSPEEAGKHQGEAPGVTAVKSSEFREGE